MTKQGFHYIRECSPRVYVCYNGGLITWWRARKFAKQVSLKLRRNSGVSWGFMGVEDHTGYTCFEIDASASKWVKDAYFMGSYTAKAEKAKEHLRRYLEEYPGKGSYDIRKK